MADLLPLSSLLATSPAPVTAAYSSGCSTNDVFRVPHIGRYVWGRILLPSPYLAKGLLDTSSSDAGKGVNGLDLALCMLNFKLFKYIA